MSVKWLQVTCASLVLVLVGAFVGPLMLQAQSQVVQPSELNAAIQKASVARKTHLDHVRSFFSSKPARAALSRTPMTSDRVNKLLGSLSADDLAKLAEKTQNIQADFAAGAMSNQDLTYVVVALATAVLVLIIVEAH
jgi:hypothetical protein